MYYKFKQDWQYTTYCIVEADNLEEAKKLAESEEWYEDNGGEHYLSQKAIFASEEDVEDFESEGEYIKWD